MDGASSFWVVGWGVLTGGGLSGDPSEGEDCQALALCWARGDTSWYH